MALHSTVLGCNLHRRSLELNKISLLPQCSFKFKLQCQTSFVYQQHTLYLVLPYTFITDYLVLHFTCCLLYTWISYIYLININQSVNHCSSSMAKRANLGLG